MTEQHNPDAPAPTPPVAEPPILATLANLKRSVSQRALMLLTVTPSAHQARSDHAELYRRLDELDLALRARYGRPSAGRLPEWVREG